MLRKANICLRGLEYEDLVQIHQNMNRFELLKSILRIQPSIKCFTEEWYKKIHKDPHQMIFAIEETTANELIGCIGAKNINFIDRKAEMYIYIFNAEHRGKGYGQTAVRLFVDYMFDYYNLHKIYLYVREDNIAAIRLYQKVGFKQEGLLREESYIEGKYLNVLRMSMLRDENHTDHEL